MFFTLINVLVTAPLFLLSAVNNFCFLFDQDVGEIFVKQVFKSWYWGTPVVLLFLYCGSQVSIETKNWELSKEFAKLSNKKIDWNYSENFDNIAVFPSVFLLSVYEQKYSTFSNFSRCV